MQRKINLLLITLAIIGIVATGLLAHALLQGQFIEGIERRLVTNAHLVREFILAQGERDDASVAAFIETLSEEAKARITYIDEHGVVLADSDATATSLDNHAQRPEVIQAYAGQVGVSQRYSDSVKIDMYYVAVPISFGNDTMRVIRLSVPLQEIKDFNYQLLRSIVMASMFGMVVAILLGFRFLKVILNPIQDMITASKEIANGRFGKHIHYESKDEMGELAETFNKMSEELEMKIMEIKDQNIKNSAILTSMLNGVIAVDNHKRVMFINPAAEELFQIREETVKGKHILEMFRNNALDEQVQTLINDHILTTIEVEIEEPRHRILNLHSNPIVSSKRANERIGVVIIIADVTEMRKLEIMRKDFVANVSHELKTPLTSIKGFVETLKNGAVDNPTVRDKFLDIIDVETSRLSILIEDLLVLSDIEKRNTMIEKSEIDVVRASDEVCQMMGAIASKKNIRIHFAGHDEIPDLFGNVSWYKQMLINLVDNAVKYTPQDGQVWVSLDEINDELRIAVKDNGIGIEEEHIERLFERFYRVDKARSRSVGGTGLGLAIVKHVVLSFGGRIDVQSVFGQGTEFIVHIPLYN